MSLCFEALCNPFRDETLSERVADRGVYEFRRHSGVDAIFNGALGCRHAHRSEPLHVGIRQIGVVRFYVVGNAQSASLPSERDCEFDAVGQGVGEPVEVERCF